MTSQKFPNVSSGGRKDIAPEVRIGIQFGMIIEKHTAAVEEEPKQSLQFGLGTKCDSDKVTFTCYEYVICFTS